jgi:hypothetical protein
MIRLFVLALLTGSLAAPAIVPPDSVVPGLEEAEKVCQALSFSDDILKCMQSVSNSTYFDVAAVKICRNLSFSSEQTKCLDAIKGKEYSKTAVATCGNMTFSDKITQCFSQMGKPYVSAATAKPVYVPHPAPAENALVRRRIVDALTQMEWGNYPEARRILTEALSILER